MKKLIVSVLIALCVVALFALAVALPVEASDRCIDPGGTGCVRPPRIVPTPTPRPPRPPVYYCIPEMPCRTMPGW